MGNTSIEWTDRTWNPTRGCSMAKGSEAGGCLNCYAARMASRNLPELKSPTTGESFARILDSGPRWTGKVELIESALMLPLKWRKPQRIFVNSMSDLFHESLSDEAIDRVFAVMAICPQHTFQCLTKRPERMLAYCGAADITHRVAKAHRGEPADGQEACHRNGREDDNRISNLRWGSRSENQQEKVRHGASGGPAKLTREQAAEIRGARKSGETQQSLADRYGISRSLVSMIESRLVWADAMPWPLPNVWLGVSIENQATADARIPLLLQTPAAKRFVSYEPALGPVDFLPFFHVLTPQGKPSMVMRRAVREPFPDQIIIGGESGPGARPFDIAWARETIRQCRAAGVAGFVKQLGARPYTTTGTPMELELGAVCDRKGGNPEEWPADLNVREYPQ